jgi:maltose alpha-D-glucosyltransferase/alpha-amylase
MTADPLWYKDASIYELHVKTFCDGNGDGIGDFPGLTRKLEYLQHLGVTCLWLLPFYESPLRDEGYDVPITSMCIPTTALGRTSCGFSIPLMPAV